MSVLQYILKGRVVFFASIQAKVIGLDGEIKFNHVAFFEWKGSELEKNSEVKRKRHKQQ